tara:strand:+ start:258 stop:887 length:630 start_codon:yes stop_codon:yes gene_type:complete
MALVKYNNNSISAVTSAENVGSGDITLIKTIDASSSSTISFVHGSSDVVLDDTYPIYMFRFINIHGSADANFTFNVSTNSGSNYNVTKTTTYFNSAHSEDDSSEAQIEYRTSDDLAQSGNFQILHKSMDSGNDDCGVGELFLFNPHSNEFVKNFISRNIYVSNGADGTAKNSHISGYANTTSAVNGVQFAMSSGNIDSGTIKLYGIKDS